MDWSKYAGVSGEGGSLGGQSWNDFQKVVDGHAKNVLHAANSQMSALKGDYWQEVEFYGLVRQMNSDALRRIDSIRIFLGREGGRLNHNFTGDSADLGSQYRQMMHQATRTAQSAKTLHKRWKDEGRTANVKHYQIRDAISTGLDFLPVLNDAKGVLESIAGKRWISNEELSPGERVITGGSSLASLFFDGAQWARAGRRITGGTIRGAGTVRGWRQGDPITNLTRQGNVPTWDTIRRRHWKNEALYNPSAWSKSNLERMRRGLAPQQRNRRTGVWESIELHHTPPRREGGLFDFVPLTPDEHAAVDSFRHLGR